MLRTQLDAHRFEAIRIVTAYMAPEAKIVNGTLLSRRGVERCPLRHGRFAAPDDLQAWQHSRGGADIKPTAIPSYSLLNM